MTCWSSHYDMMAAGFYRSGFFLKGINAIVRATCPVNDNQHRAAEATLPRSQHLGLGRGESWPSCATIWLDRMSTYGVPGSGETPRAWDGRVSLMAVCHQRPFTRNSRVGIGGYIDKGGHQVGDFGSSGMTFDSQGCKYLDFANSNLTLSPCWSALPQAA